MRNKPNMDEGGIGEQGSGRRGSGAIVSNKPNLAAWVMMRNKPNLPLREYPSIPVSYCSTIPIRCQSCETNPIGPDANESQVHCDKEVRNDSSPGGHRQNKPNLQKRGSAGQAVEAVGRLRQTNPIWWRGQSCETNPICHRRGSQCSGMPVPSPYEQTQFLDAQKGTRAGKTGGAVGRGNSAEQSQFARTDRPEAPGGLTSRAVRATHASGSQTRSFAFGVPSPLQTDASERCHRMLAMPLGTQDFYHFFP